jgi:hypothetical protein
MHGCSGQETSLRRWRTGSVRSVGRADGDKIDGSEETYLFGL